MASNNLTDQYWEAARHAVHGAFQDSVHDSTLVPRVGELGEIHRFLDYHLGLQGTGKDHTFSIILAINATTAVSQDDRPLPLAAESIRKFNYASLSFVRGVRSMMDPSSSRESRTSAVGLIALISDQWFNSPEPVMEPKERSEFCGHLAMFIDINGHPTRVKRAGISIFFGMLRSQGWRNHIVPKLWKILAEWTLVDEEQESFKWCLQNATEILEFTGRSPSDQRFKWWYGTLWFHFDKLDQTVRGEVETIAKDMLSGGGLSDLNLYLGLIKQVVNKMRRELDGLAEYSGMKQRARLITLEGNSRRLDRITDGE